MKTKDLNYPWFHLNSFEIIIERVLLRVLFRETFLVNFNTFQLIAIDFSRRFDFRLTDSIILKNESDENYTHFYYPLLVEKKNQSEKMAQLLFTHA